MKGVCAQEAAHDSGMWALVHRGWGEGGGVAGLGHGGVRERRRRQTPA